MHAIHRAAQYQVQIYKLVLQFRTEHFDTPSVMQQLLGRSLYQTHAYTVEPLTNDHPHQRPSLSYDHISCDGQ